MSSAPPPLDKVVILDLTQVYNGPYATFLLAQAGATVIKIEPPGGEHLRKRERATGVAQPFATLNANKKSVVLNLHVACARDALLKMAARADVVVENFAPGVMSRLGLGPEVLRQANPDIIIASSSGYGSEGPYRSYPAMDLTVQAMSGVMSVTGSPDGPPLKAGPAVCDFFAGTHLYGAIVTALYDRARTGRAGTVEVSMLSAVYPSLLSSLGMHHQGDRNCKRTGNRHGGLTMAPYNVYPTADGAIAILAARDEHWLALTRALGCEDWLADARYATRPARISNMDVLDDELGRITSRYAKEDLFKLLLQHRIPCAPVRELDEVINDRHLHATGMLRWVDHPDHGRLLTHGSPIVFQDRATPGYEPSSALGADARDVLRDFCGLTPRQIDELDTAGALQ